MLADSLSQIQNLSDDRAGHLPGVFSCVAIFYPFINRPVHPGYLVKACAGCLNKEI